MVDCAAARVGCPRDTNTSVAMIKETGTWAARILAKPARGLWLKLSGSGVIHHPHYCLDLFCLLTRPVVRRNGLLLAFCSLRARTLARANHRALSLRLTSGTL